MQISMVETSLQTKTWFVRQQQPRNKIFIFCRFIKQLNPKMSLNRVIFWVEVLHTCIAERMKSVFLQIAMYWSAGDIQLLDNFSYTPSSNFLNDIQYCLFISQGPCGSCTSANFIPIRQNFPCFLNPSKYSQNCFLRDCTLFGCLPRLFPRR
jgi:hypothetical protein